MEARCPHIALTSAALALALSGCPPADNSFARATVIESLDQTIGGPMSAAQPGDILLENRSEGSQGTMKSHVSRHRHPRIGHRLATAFDKAVFVGGSEDAKSSY